MRFLISTGEASGELYGAHLIKALRRRLPAAEFFGVGGERMRAAGCDTVVDAARLSVVGISEIVSHLPRIYGDFRRLVRAADERRPDAAIVIDSPAFNFRVAREMHRRRVPVIYYVCPQLWAWRERRVERFRKWVKKALVIFPFEEQWYRERGVNAEYVGHPLAELPPPAATRAEFAARPRLNPAKTWVALLPGSREPEVRRHIVTMARGAAALGGYRWVHDGEQLKEVEPEIELVFPVAPTLANSVWGELLNNIPTLDFNPGISVALVHNAREALMHARAAVVASGTATVEAALLGTPMVVVYQVSSLTWLLGRRLLRVPYVAMPNIIAGHRVVPELLQSEFTPENVARELRPLLEDGPAREKMLAGLAEVNSRLRSPGASGTASERAADAILRTLA